MKFSKVFDFNKALEILMDKKPECAIAGLLEDMNYSACQILNETGLVCESGYLSSDWATPVLVIDREVFPCWVYDTPSDNPDGFKADSVWKDKHIEKWNGKED